MLWKDPVVVEAVVLCVCVCWWQSVVLCQFVVQFSSVAVAVCCCCCCGRVVVVGAEGRAGSVDCSSLLPRVVLGEVAAVRAAATQTVGGLEEEEEEAVGVSAIAVVASMAETCLVEDVGEGHVELPVAKARAARCRCSTWLC